MSNNVKKCFINGVQYKCRTCFDPGETFYSLDDECSDSKTWRDLFNYVAELKTTNDKLLPNTVCCKCLDKIISYYDFILYIKNVNNKYLQLLANDDGPVQDGVLSVFNNFTDCLAESAIALPMAQFVSEIKFEEESVASYDIVDNNIKDDSIEKDTNDPFQETCDEDVKFPLNELHDQQSSSSSNESEYTPFVSQESDKDKFTSTNFQIKKTNGRFVCPICTKSFTAKVYCRRHINAIHGQGQEFICGFCGHRYRCKRYLTAHIRRMHPEESFITNMKKLVLLYGDRLYSKPVPWLFVECKLCETSFRTTNELRHHLQNHSNLYTLESLELNSRIVQHWFSDINDLNVIKEIICNDIRENDWYKYYTVLNEYSFEMSVSDTEVEDLEDGPADRICKYKCELCGKAFSYKYEVFAHMKEDHIKDDIPLQCKRCKLEFVSIKMYENHKQTHCRNKYKNCHCSYCPGKFVSTENMNNHSCIQSIPDNSKAVINVVTGNDKLLASTIIIRCCLCEMVFEKLRDLRQHMPLHEDGKTGIDFKNCMYIKQILDSDSIDFAMLQKQIKEAFFKRQISYFYQAIDKHGNEMDISDSDSDSDSSTENIVTKNERKIYKCDLCKEIFRRRKLLLNHQRKQHSENDQMPYTCEHCSQQYISIHLLQQHLKRECWNEQRRIATKCDQCNARFIWKSNMLKHKEIQHQSSERSIKRPVSYSGVQLRYCFLCPKTFFSTKQLNEHLSRHQLAPSAIKTLESIVHSTWWPNGRKIIRCKVCDLEFRSMAKLREHFSCKDTEPCCGKQHSPVNYSIVNQKGFELHLELDSETEDEDSTEAKNNDRNIKSLLPYDCCMCSRSFERKYQISQHQRSMHNYEMLELKCESCFYRTVSQKVLDYHRNTQCFNIEKKYKCDQCNFKFMWEENLDNHVAKFHSAKGYEKVMNTLNMEISSPDGVSVNDLQSMSGKNILNLDSCKQSKSTGKKCKKGLLSNCDMPTTSSYLEERVKRNKIKESLKCNLCEITFLSSADQKKHIRTHTLESPFKCDICGKSFTGKRKLNIHKLMHTAERPYQCKICQKSFKYPANLKQHERIHKPDNPYKCNVCQKTFKIDSYLKAHRKATGHSENADLNDTQQPLLKEITLCPICGTALSSKTNLKFHMRIHTGERPYKCDLCEKTCARKFDLDLHKRTHFTDRPFKCSICEKSFIRPGKLKDHMRMHTGERPFQCTICQKKFNRKLYMQRHLLTHKDVKPFTCEICDRRFTCAAYLKTHCVKQGHFMKND